LRVGGWATHTHAHTYTHTFICELCGLTACGQLGEGPWNAVITWVASATGIKKCGSDKIDLATVLHDLLEDIQNGGSWYPLVVIREPTSYNNTFPLVIVLQ
jgi:hypothetical protein